MELAPTPSPSLHPAGCRASQFCWQLTALLTLSSSVPPPPFFASSAQMCGWHAAPHRAFFGAQAQGPLPTPASTREPSLDDWGSSLPSCLLSPHSEHYRPQQPHPKIAWNPSLLSIPNAFALVEPLLPLDSAACCRIGHLDSIHTHTQPRSFLLTTFLDGDSLSKSLPWCLIYLHRGPGRQQLAFPLSQMRKWGLRKLLRCCICWVPELGSVLQPDCLWCTGLSHCTPPDSVTEASTSVPVNRLLPPSSAHGSTFSTHAYAPCTHQAVLLCSFCLEHPPPLLPHDICPFRFSSHITSLRDLGSEPLPQPLLRPHVHVVHISALPRRLGGCVCPCTPRVQHEPDPGVTSRMVLLTALWKCLFSAAFHSALGSEPPRADTVCLAGFVQELLCCCADGLQKCVAKTMNTFAPLLWV